ncbi:glycerate kinase [Parafrankia irregularis]|uniref:Glycerate kinase n=1 Tax=Parafrankia irregularis TaxID=795642 RepID=A0A0S4QU28_9ACTN|nr:MULTISPECIES: glycerate kinase [Parafrankia]MBE3202738.1 glycerate kinase [Parafrankia sp. CH37]CUU57926.1 glycerate kinase [Parafrankia irregularis]
MSAPVPGPVRVPGRPLRVVIAPDSFKGSVSATEAAAALASGWSATRPDDVVVTIPIADGGEGTLDSFAAAVPGTRRHELDVTGPDGRPVTGAAWLELPDGSALVELAQASGLPLMSAPDPLNAHTFGLGELVGAALDTGVRSVLVALGGSASTDGGTGLLAALGARFLNAAGRPLALGGGALADLAAVDLHGLRPGPPEGIRCLVDVTAPLLGPRGAATVFGPQKGAGPAEIDRLEAGLARLAALMPGLGAAGQGSSRSGTSGAADVGSGSVGSGSVGSGSAGPVLAEQPGTGAAGGTAYGLAAALGATLVPGARSIAEHTGLPAALAEADLVITGEGRFDRTSLGGKVVGGVVTMAQAAGVPVLLVAGQVDGPVPAAVSDALALVDLAGDRAHAIARPGHWLTLAGARLAERPGAPRISSVPG